jgi:hypothetical protein
MGKCTYISQKGTVYFCIITQRVVVAGQPVGQTLEDGADRLSRNVGKELPLLAA